MADKVIKLPRGRVPVNPEKRALYLKKAAEANGTTAKKIEEFINNGAASNAPYTPAHKFDGQAKPKTPAPTKATNVIMTTYRESFIEIFDSVSEKPVLFNIENVIGVRPLSNGGVALLVADDKMEQGEIESPESYESFRSRLATVANVLLAPEIPITVEAEIEPSNNGTGVVV